MASPASSVELLCLFERLAPKSLFADLTPEKGAGSGKGIYSFAVVIWLMIVQRLHAKGTLSSALQQLLQVRPGNLLPDCKRVRDGNISPHPGGYCQARQNMPTLVARKVCDHILDQLQRELPVCPEGCSHPVFLLDGSSLELASTAELAAAYPPAENQHGAAHWPIVRIAVMHNLANGLALRPSWGPMSGPDAVSEQALSETLMDRLPPKAVIVGDRNFGIFSVVYAAWKKGFPVVLRLTKERFQKVWNGTAVCGQDGPVEWLASRSDRLRHPDLPPQASVRGRMLVAQMQSGSTTEFLYLFTTLDLPAQQILEIYRCRWNIETDLRSLKSTIRLHHIPAKTSQMVEKEILIATTAYNMVRAVMGWAAQQAGISPRSLSFSHVQDVVEAALPVLAAAESPDQYAFHFRRMLNYAARCKLPIRSRRRTFPRTIWGHHQSFPKRKAAPLLSRSEKTI
jgi:putative transposase